MRVSQKSDPSTVRLDANAVERIMQEWPGRLDDPETVLRIMRAVFHTARSPRPPAITVDEVPPLRYHDHAHLVRFDAKKI